jgi:hypothetical protein
MAWMQTFPECHASLAAEDGNVEELRTRLDSPEVASYVYGSVCVCVYQV